MVVITEKYGLNGSLVSGDYYGALRRDLLLVAVDFETMKEGRGVVSPRNEYQILVVFQVGTKLQ